MVDKATLVAAFQHFQVIADELATATWPIYLNGVLDASGVLLRIDGRSFLLTAAHVADRAKEGTLEIGAGNGRVQLGGQYWTTRVPPTGRREDDSLDLCVWFLDTSDWPELPRNTYIELEQVEARRSTAATSYCFLIGFPGSKHQTRRSKHAVHPRTLTYAARCLSAEQHRAAGFDPAVHLLFEFDKKRSRTLSGQITAPEPYGMSGGGVWSVPQLLDEPHPSVELAALLIGLQPGSHRHMMASRVVRCLELIASKCPDHRVRIQKHLAPTRVAT